LTQGVVKHIIPAVASTNAVVAAACAIEVFKMASSCASKLDNYMVFNDTDGKKKKEERGGEEKFLLMYSSPKTIRRDFSCFKKGKLQFLCC
jgi:ubiquitin-activating enzyme E1 C